MSKVSLSAVEDVGEMAIEQTLRHTDNDAWKQWRNPLALLHSKLAGAMGFRTWCKIQFIKEKTASLIKILYSQDFI